LTFCFARRSRYETKNNVIISWLVHGRNSTITGRLLRFCVAAAVPLYTVYADSRLSLPTTLSEHTTIQQRKTNSRNRRKKKAFEPSGGFGFLFFFPSCRFFFLPLFLLYLTPPQVLGCLLPSSQSFNVHNQRIGIWRC
jgi:hypothetical protein